MYMIACATHTGAADQDLSKMRDTLDRVQADRDTEEKPLAETDVPKAAPTTKRSTNSTTPQKVVRLEGSDEPFDEATEDDTRPAIRLVGSQSFSSERRNSKKSLQNASARSGERMLRIEETRDSDIPADGPRPSALDPEARRAYDSALALVFAHRHDEGLDALAAFLAKWPDHPNADNAHYWRGECFAAKGDSAHAMQEFETVVNQFPLGNKVPDAMLKLANVKEKLGQKEEANAIRKRLLENYSKSPAARKLREVKE